MSDILIKSFFKLLVKESNLSDVWLGDLYKVIMQPLLLVRVTSRVKHLLKYELLKLRAGKDSLI